MTKVRGALCNTTKKATCIPAGGFPDRIATVLLTRGVKSATFQQWLDVRRSAGEVLVQLRGID